MIDVSAPWSDQERAAWAPPERLSGSEWAERYHMLPRRGTAEPGPYRLDRTPYVRGILDALTDEEHTEVVLCKGVQIGGTELGKAAIGCWIDQGEGDPILLTLPNQKAAEAYIVERIQPLLEIPRLARYVTSRTYDVRKDQIDLVHMSIHLAWSGSPQTMASRAIRYAVSDEVDKAQDTAKEAASLDLVRDRLVTFGHRAKHFILSTPTTTLGPIWVAFESTADKRYFHVPCPHCGAAQRLVWEQVRWDGREDTLAGADTFSPERALQLADDLLSGRAAAWYECAHCGDAIEERDRMPAVEAGEWVSVLGPNPVSRRVAFHISALYSPWVSFGRLVSEYLRAVAEDDMRNFRNAFLALPQEDGPICKREEDVFTARAKLHRPGIVPEWATIVTAGADTQARNGHPYWVYTVRAWGPRFRSRLIAAGIATTPEELARLTVDARFPVEGAPGLHVSPLICCVDSGGAAELIDGNTTWTVYQMSRRDPGRMIAVKGHGGSTRPDRKIQTRQIMYQPPGAPTPPVPVLLHVLDVEFFKDRLYSLIYDEDGALWEESDCLPPGYAAQMTAEEKARVKVGARKVEVRWVNNTRQRTDYWDASVYCLAAAHMVRADERRAAREAARPRPSPPPRHTDAPSYDRPRPRFAASGRSGWISRRR